MNTLLSAVDIQKYYPKSNFILSVPRLDLFEGTITGVVGENGNGKTTLLNIIAGELEANGKFNYFPDEGNSENSWVELKNKIAFIPQRIPRWYGTLIQNLTLKAALEGVPPSEIDNILDDILNFLDLQPYRHLTWSEISTGYRLRFELARTLLGKPNILVLDEPLANLDINTQQKFLSDLRNILRDKAYPTAVLLSSQQLHEIEAVADHMVFLRKGKAMFSGNVDSLEESEEYFIFELQVDNPDSLIMYLENAKLSYKRTGEYFNIEFLKTAPKKTLLKDLISQGFEIRYFRDISKSTKRLFAK